MTALFSIEWSPTSAPSVEVEKLDNGMFNYTCRTPFHLASKIATWTNQLLGARAEQVIGAAEDDLEKFPEEFDKLLERLQLAETAAG